jgi:O-antigen/teichoic acid export membrane protein
MLGRLLDKVPHGHKLASGASWAFGIRMLTMLLGLATSALLARLLSPEALGVYFLLFTLVTVAVVFSQLGLNQSIVRLISEPLGSEGEGRVRPALRLVFVWAGLGALLTAALVRFGGGRWFALEVFEAPLMAGSLGFAAAWIIILTFQRLIAEAFRGFHDIRLASVFGGFVTALLSVALFLGLLLRGKGASLDQVLLLTIVASMASCSLAATLLLGKVRRLRSTPAAISQREIWELSWPMFLGNVLNVLLQRADLWLLGMFQPAEQVAVYGAAARLILLVSLPATIAGAVVPPMIAQLFAQQRTRELQKVMRATATVSALPALLVCAVFVVLGEPLLHLVYGDYYRAGAPVLAILAAGQMVSAWAGGCGPLMLMTGHQKPLLVINVACMLVAVAGSLLLVRPLGAVGVATAFAASVALQNIVSAVYGARRIGVKTWVAVPIRTGS